jgi:hypothetical protein
MLIYLISFIVTNICHKCVGCGLCTQTLITVVNCICALVFTILCIVFLVGSYGGGIACYWGFDAIDDRGVLDQLIELKQYPELSDFMDVCNYQVGKKREWLLALDKDGKISSAIEPYSTFTTWQDPVFQTG